MSIKKGDPEWNLSARNDLIDEIWKSCSDGTVLHQHIRAGSRGPRIAARLPGSASGASVIASGVVLAEDNGSAPPGFSSDLLARIQAANV